MILGNVSYQFTEHSSTIRDLAVCNATNVAVTCDSSGAVKAWDIETGSVITDFTGHSDWARAVGITADGQYAISVSDLPEAIVWEVNTGIVITTYTGSHTQRIVAADISPDGVYAATSSYDDPYDIEVWEAMTGTLVTTFSLHDYYLEYLKFSPDSKYVVSAGNDTNYEVRVWEAETGNEVTNHTLHTDTISSVDFHPTEKYILSGSHDKKVIVYDYENDVVISTSPEHGNDVYFASFSPDGKFYITACRDDYIRIFETETGNLLYTFQGHEGTDTETAAIAPNKIQAISSAGSTAIVWDAVGTNGLIYFKDSEGLPLNVDGLVYDGINLSTIQLSRSSDIVSMSFVNDTGLSLQNIEITATNEATGVDLLLSTTEDPFEELQSLTYAGPIADGIETTFYLKLDTEITAGTGTGNVQLNITAEETA